MCVEVSVGLLFVLPLTSSSPAFKSQPLTSIGLQQSENAPEVTLQSVSGSPSHMIIQVKICFVCQGLLEEFEGHSSSSKLESQDVEVSSRSSCADTLLLYLCSYLFFFLIIKQL